jgi:ribosome recycling factor
MNEEVTFAIDSCKELMDKAISHLITELTKVRAGKANPSMLDGVKVDYYGSQTQLSQVANINTPDGKTLSIQPWEKAMLEPISTAIMYANLGLNPQNNGELIIISIPALTEERRKDLVKKAKSETEHGKVSIRNARKEAMDVIKKEQKEGFSEDAAKDAEAQVQELTNVYIAKCDNIAVKKEKDILTI